MDLLGRESPEVAFWRDFIFRIQIKSVTQSPP